MFGFPEKETNNECLSEVKIQLNLSRLNVSESLYKSNNQYNTWAIALGQSSLEELFSKDGLVTMHYSKELCANYKET